MKNRGNLIPEKRIVLTPDSEFGKELLALANGNFDHDITDEVMECNFFKEMQDTTHLEISGFGQRSNALTFATKISGISKTLQTVKVNLGRNDLCLYSWGEIIENLSKAPLNALDLSGNYLEYTGNELSYYIAYHMPNLKILSLSKNNLGLYTIGSVQELLKLPYLQVLNLSDNTDDVSIIDQIRDIVEKYNIKQPEHNESLFYAVNYFVLGGHIIQDVAPNILGYHEHPVELII